MDCKTAGDILAQAALKREPPPEEMETAIQHAAECLACQVRLQALVRAVGADDIPCAEARAHFDDYLATQEAGRDMVRLFPAVHRHLESCPGCTAEMETLASLLAIAETEPLEVSGDRAPHFDLSFVDEGQGLWGLVGTHTRRLDQPIRVLVEKGKAALGDVTGSLQALQPAPAYALRCPADGSAMLTIPDEGRRLRLHLGVGETEDARTTLLVMIESTARQRPLSGVRLSLLDGERQLLERQHTSGRGLVTFAHLPFGRYWLVIQIEGDTWEVSVPISSAKEVLHD